MTVHGAVVGEAEVKRLSDADEFLRVPLDAFPLRTAGAFTFCVLGSFSLGTMVTSNFGTFGFFMVTLGAL